MEFSNRIQQIKTSPIRSLNAYAQAARDRGLEVIPLNIGQPDLPTPDEFFEAVHNYPSDVLAYEDSRGMPETIRAMQDYFSSFGQDFEAEEIVINNGASESLTHLMLTLLDTGDEILTIEPFYANYDSFVKIAGGQLVGVPTNIEDNYHMPSLETFEAKITDRTKAILLSNPSNPTGRVYDKDEVETVIEVALKHDLFIIADEVYRIFNFTDRPFYSFGDYDEVRDRVILVDSISKKYSACGARIGAIASHNQELMQHLLHLCQSRLAVSTLDQVGAAAMIDLPASFIEKECQTYNQRRQTISKRLAEIPGLVFHEPEGAFYNIIGLPVENAEAFIIWMLENIEVDGRTLLMTPAHAFYTTPGRGLNEVRLSYCVSEEKIEQAMDILEAALAAYPGRLNH